MLEARRALMAVAATSLPFLPALRLAYHDPLARRFREPGGVRFTVEDDGRASTGTGCRAGRR